MSQTIVFIHGMFQNPESWAQWVQYFEALGYRCLAPAWPLHEGEPAALRANPPAALGDLGLEEIIQSIEGVIAGEIEKPIGHHHPARSGTQEPPPTAHRRERSICGSSPAAATTSAASPAGRRWRSLSPDGSSCRVP